MNGSHVQEYADDPRLETQSFVDPFDGKTLNASAPSRTLDKSCIGLQLDAHY
ncbi:MAG TPA: hypothetical protein VGZ00_13220 [Candidatus Baltobacteraceae bacterium]|nr:hypothetical protein [Candidatus Baltobacteraceae bacterium]